jgi:hypothetical protein
VKAINIVVETVKFVGCVVKEGALFPTDPASTLVMQGDGKTRPLAA